MTKQRKKEAVIPAQATIQEDANIFLAGIQRHIQEIERLQSAYNEAVAALTESFEARVKPHQETLKQADGALKVLMRVCKKELFADTDVVYLLHGSLLHAIVDKVRIPKDALAKCEELGWSEVIKIAKSLDREAVEKWSDEKLVLIGAERKPKEEFSYDLKKEAKP